MWFKWVYSCRRLEGKNIFQFQQLKAEFLFLYPKDSKSVGKNLSLTISICKNLMHGLFKLIRSF